MLTQPQLRKAQKIKKYCEDVNRALKLRHGDLFVKKFSCEELCDIGGIETVTITKPKNSNEWQDIRNWINNAWAEGRTDLCLESIPGARGGIKVGPRLGLANVVGRNYKISEGLDKSNQAKVEKALEENTIDEFVSRLADLGITPKMLGSSTVRADTQKLLESENEDGNEDGNDED